MELGTFLLLTMSSSAAWCALYGLVCRLQSHRSKEWNSRVITVVHALVSLTMSSVFGFFYNPWPFTHPGGESNDYETGTMMVSNGYFLFEFVRGSLVTSGHSTAMTLHHLVCILFGSASLLSGVSGTEICFTLFLAELTNPMLQGRWFMRSSGIAGGLLYELNQLLFLVVFTVIRMGIGSYWIYSYLQHPRPHAFFKLGASLLYLVGWVFMVQILAVVNRRFKRRGRKGAASDSSKGRGH